MATGGGSLQLIDGAPGSLSPLVEWLGGLSPEARRLCGLAAIFGAIDSELAETGSIDVEALKRSIVALHRVGVAAAAAIVPGKRRRKRSVDGDAKTKDGGNESADEAEAGRGETVDDMVTMLGLKCPHAGDAVLAREIADGNSKLVKKLVEAVEGDAKLKKLWTCERRKVEGARGSPPLFIVRR